MPDLSPGYAAADIAFVTPTWRGDLERFQLLRESMAAMGLGAVPHYAVVQTEDLALFRQGAAGPIYLSTAEVLPSEVEQRRRRHLDRTPNRRLQVLKRSAYKRFGWFADANYYGWHTQQLVKLAVARQFPQRVLITLDSDVIFTQPVPASAYAADGRVVLYEEPDVITRPLASPGWYGHACTLFQPLGQWSEFMTYGVYVSQLRQYAGVWTERASLACRWLHTAEERAHPEAAINAAFDDPEVRYLTIQADHHAHFRVADYAPWVRSALALRAA